MLDKLKNYFRLQKALRLIAAAYSDQIDLTVSCSLISGTVYVEFKTILDELDSSEIQWLAPEAYDTLTSLNLIEPAQQFVVGGSNEI
jgi:hypothetical protein